MFKVIFAKEILESINNFRFMVAFLIALTAIPLGFYANAREYQARYKDYQKTLQIYEESHKTIRDSERLGAAAFRPPSALSILSAGVEYLLPSGIESEGGWLSSFGAQARFNNTRTLYSPQLYLYGALDLTFIVSIVISLLAMLLTYSSVAGEKEQGTLSLVLSNAVPRSTVIAAKMLANGVLLNLAFILGVLIGVVVLLAMGLDVPTGSGFVIRFVFGIAVSVLYVFVLSNFGILVSSLNKRAISAIVSLMFCWAIFFMIFPKASVILAKIAMPVRSQRVVEMEKSQIRRQFEADEFAELQKLRKTFAVVKDMSFQEFMIKLRDNDKDVLAFEKKQNEIKAYYGAKCSAELASRDAFYEIQRINQAGLARDISRFSPVSCYIHVMVESSNVGIVEYEQWKQTRSRFKQLLESEIIDKIRKINFGNIGSSVFTGDEQAQMPIIEYLPVPFQRTFIVVLPDLILLLVYLILFFMGAFVSFIRYDAR